MTTFQILSWVVQVVWIGLTWRKWGFFAALNMFAFAAFCGFMLAYALDHA